MLTVKCAACKKKLFRYYKVGKGEVLRCHKTRIDKMYDVVVRDKGLYCPCGKAVGLDKGTFYKMIDKAFTYTGTKN